MFITSYTVGYEAGIQKTNFIKQVEQVKVDCAADRAASATDRNIIVASGGVRLLKTVKKIKLLQPELDDDILLEYATYISHCMTRWGLDDNLVISMIQLESGFNPDARSSAGALGMMQILYKTWSTELGLSEEKLLDPGINIWAGCKILSQYKTKYPNDYLDRYGGFEPGSGIYQSKLTKYLRRISWL